MFSASASLYDLIYSSFKDYQAEAAEIAELIGSEHPGATSVLDVACGTGEHARFLSHQFGYRVDGVDLEPEFVRIGREKNPAGRYWEGDMRAFDAGRRYDVVLCLFSSIGYMRTVVEVVKALSNFARHVTESGLIIVEPWITPEAWKPGSLYMTTVEKEGLKVCRMGHSDLEGTISRVTLEYLVGTPEGIRHMREHHELGLFTVEQMEASFRAAGLTVRYDAPGPSGRGLYVARKAA